MRRLKEGVEETRVNLPPDKTDQRGVVEEGGRAPDGVRWNTCERESSVNRSGCG